MAIECYAIKGNVYFVRNIKRTSMKPDNALMLNEAQETLIPADCSDMELQVFHQFIHDLLFKQKKKLSRCVPDTDMSLCAQLQFTGIWIQADNARFMLDWWCRRWLSFSEWKQLEAAVREK